MAVQAREMSLEETPIVVDYFLGSTPEHLDLLGVDPSRLPAREAWVAAFTAQYALPLERRRSVFLIWLVDDRPVGFSSCDKIAYGERANMHLHITDPTARQQGFGVDLVKQSVDIYFRALQLRQLFCEPNAFNIGPNRTLQRAGVTYIKTYKTVPGPLNFHQAVTRWMIDRS